MVRRLVKMLALLLYVGAIVGMLLSMASIDILLLIGCALVAGLAAIMFEY